MSAGEVDWLPESLGGREAPPPSANPVSFRGRGRGWMGGVAPHGREGVPERYLPKFWLF